VSDDDEDEDEDEDEERDMFAPCWCTRVMVESTAVTQSSAPAASLRAWTAVKICCQVPSLAHRSKVL
jgi:hypothetical protein